MATRKRKGPASAGPKPNLPGTIEISDDFIGLKDADGNVLVDDTAHFRQRELERPIEEALEESEGLRFARAKVEEAIAPLRERDEELARTISIFHGWVEQAIVATCARLLEEAKRMVDSKKTAPSNLYEGVGHIVHLSSGAEGRTCNLCVEPDGDDFGEKVSHYIEKHGYQLLHVGVESSYEREGGQVWNDTVAVLGRKIRDA